MRVQILTTISGVQFEACWSRRCLEDLDGLLVSVIGLADLKINKAASGRPKDLADLEELP
jgi:hypothetical protein